MSHVLSRAQRQKWRPTEFRPLGHLHRPKFYRYRVAQPRRFRPCLNGYPYSVIGLGVVIGQYGYSVTWGTPASYERRRS